LQGFGVATSPSRLLTPAAAGGVATLPLSSAPAAAGVVAVTIRTCQLQNLQLQVVLPRHMSSIHWHLPAAGVVAIAVRNRS